MSCPIEFTNFNSLLNSIERNLDGNNVNRNARTIVSEFRQIINRYIRDITSQINDYNNVLNSYNNVNDLLQQYREENAILTDQLKNASSDTLTNNRKTYYKDQQNNVLDTYYFYLLVIYAIVLGSFVISMLIYGTYNSQKLVLLVLFVLLPFISTFLLGTIIYIMNLIYSLLPKNANH